jgi:hypothetical protein
MQRQERLLVLLVWQSLHPLGSTVRRGRAYRLSVGGVVWSGLGTLLLVVREHLEGLLNDAVKGPKAFLIIIIELRHDLKCHGWLCKEE